MTKPELRLPFSDAQKATVEQKCSNELKKFRFTRSQASTSGKNQFKTG